MNASVPSPSSVACFGECRDCGVTHTLEVGNAWSHAQALMAELRTTGRLDTSVSESDADPGLSLARLYPPGHGNMFGVLECEDARGATVVLRAFSSMPRGIREIDGWVSPNLRREFFYGVVVPERKRIEALTARLEAIDPKDPERHTLLERRRRASRTLVRKIQDAYRFSNFRGEERNLTDAVWPPRRAIGGIGECCAPKLLDHAARNGLVPRGLAEFYWGDSKSHVAGRFYPSCAMRCRPILGFMLCGSETG